MIFVLLARVVLVYPGLEMDCHALVPVFTCLVVRALHDSLPLENRTTFFLSMVLRDIIAEPFVTNVRCRRGDDLPCVKL